MHFRKSLLSLFIQFIFPLLAISQQLEKLDRGIVAIKNKEKEVFISWRAFKEDAANLGFNVYRTTNGKSVKLNSAPITSKTWFIDTTFQPEKDNTWFVKSILDSKEKKEDGSFTVLANSKAKPYFSIPLQTPEGYSPNDASVGDLDGDGQYEIVLHQTGRGYDNSHTGLTDPPILQAYKMDGTLLWEINLGKNIREGAHYTQFLVYDFDGDGKAELVCKTADGTQDGQGKIIGDATKDWRSLYENSKTYGKILNGPEYLSAFEGTTGKALATVDYIPPRGNIGGWGGKGGNGGNDRNGNRVDRFTAAVAYLDGKHPSFVMCRGYYGRSVLAAFDFQNGEITSRWVFDTENGKNPYSGQGNHGLSVADVDNDGKDEIIFGAMTVDDDGTGLYTTGFRHGDALHVSDLDPEIPGLEVFGVHEIEEHTTGPGVTLRKAIDGSVLFKAAPNRDVGRGVAANIDTTRIGAQMWWLGDRNLYDIKGHKMGSAPRETNFLIWWDGDATRELLDGTHITKYGKGMIFNAEGTRSNNWSKATPSLSGDILGDWREELILPSKDNRELRVYSTTIPTDIKLPTLMQDRQYRLSIAWQNVGYNQPPHPGFYLGTGWEKYYSE
ncbi:rhamnogalacturonan lyase [Zunongwangia pacifica]|uniref:Rhamnogalacturonan lyase n=1 Tax=Zunongwangia pacifica TaxID=2911062 RepID=A0A9X2CNZ6_9FLAO|nr:rhamnogalacturonan lyase [Zunongwangia pacifica]MCL6217488.1 rhamnogalacturonan lyase [Zunongwangia pacifica]